jgi:hypothetical protein
MGMGGGAPTIIGPTGPRGLANPRFGNGTNIYGGIGGSSSSTPSASTSPDEDDEPDEEEPKLSNAQKKNIYDEYVRSSQNIQTDVKKLSKERKQMFLWKSGRELLPGLALKHHLTQLEIQWIVNHGDELKPEDSRALATASHGTQPTSKNEAQWKGIFKDWAKQRDKALKRSMKEKTQSRRDVSMKLEDQRLVKELTAKYRITHEELDRIEAYGAEHNWW